MLFKVNVVLFTFSCSRWWYYSFVEECSDHGESTDWWRHWSDRTERGGRQENVIFGGRRASMSLDVGVDQNTTIMTKLCQTQQQFPHQIDNCGHGNRSVDQKVTILPTCVNRTNRCSRTPSFDITISWRCVITPSFDITRTGASRPALRGNAQRIQLLHTTTFLQSMVRRRLVWASTVGTRLHIQTAHDGATRAYVYETCWQTQ